MTLKNFTLGLVVAAALLAPARADEYRLGNLAQPTKQSVHLKVDPAQDQFEGSTEIDLKILQSTNVIRFHCVDIDVTSAHLVAGKSRTELKRR